MTDTGLGSTLILTLLSLAAIAAVVARYRTVLLGFTVFAFFKIAGPGFSGFLMAISFNLSMPWLTAMHLEAIRTTALGLIAFSVGVWMAWRPLRGKSITDIWQIEAKPTGPGSFIGAASAQQRISRLPWLNIRFAVLCLIIATGVSILSPIISGIPTVNIIWSNFQTVLPLGMLIALLASQISRKYMPLLISLVVFALLVLLNATSSGHIGFGGAFMFQLLLAATFSLGVRVRTLPLFLGGMLLFASLIVGWMASRDVIRSGQLAEYDEIDRIGRFIEEFEYTSPLDLTPEQVQEVVRLRVDMTDILASQVYYQPQIEPYAYGGTIFDNLAAALIPRFLWPEKPRFVGGSDFASRYTGIDFGDNVSVGLPYQFELYANGGQPVVIVGLFVLGWLAAYLERRMVTHNMSLPWFLVLSYLTFAVANGGQTIVSVIISILAGTIGFYVLGYVLEGLNKAYGFWQEPAAEPVSLPSATQPAGIPQRSRP